MRRRIGPSIIFLEIIYVLAKNNRYAKSTLLLLNADKRKEKAEGGFWSNAKGHKLKLPVLSILPKTKPGFQTRHKYCVSQS